MNAPRYVINCTTGEEEHIALTSQEIEQQEIDRVANEVMEAEEAAQREAEKAIRLQEMIEVPDEPPAGEAFLYLKNVDGKRTVCVRSNNDGGDPDITELVRET